MLLQLVIREGETWDASAVVAIFTMVLLTAENTRNTNISLQGEPERAMTLYSETQNVKSPAVLI